MGGRGHTLANKTSKTREQVGWNSSHALEEGLFWRQMGEKRVIRTGELGGRS